MNHYSEHWIVKFINNPILCFLSPINDYLILNILQKLIVLHLIIRPQVMFQMYQWTLTFLLSHPWHIWLLSLPPTDLISQWHLSFLFIHLWLQCSPIHFGFIWHNCFILFQTQWTDLNRGSTNWFMNSNVLHWNIYSNIYFELNIYFEHFFLNWTFIRTFILNWLLIRINRTLAPNFDRALAPNFDSEYFYCANLQFDACLRFDLIPHSLLYSHCTHCQSLKHKHVTAIERYMFNNCILLI